VPHRRKIAQHDGAGLLRGRDDAPGAPFAGMASGKADIWQIGQRLDHAIICLALDPVINVDDHRTVALGPMPRHLRRPVQRCVAQHDKANRHAQLPLDISPRISSWRQLMYFSLHLHHRSGCVLIPAR